MHQWLLTGLPVKDSREDHEIHFNSMFNDLDLHHKGVLKDERTGVSLVILGTYCLDGSGGILAFPAGIPRPCKTVHNRNKAV